VKNHVNHIYAKLAVTSRGHAIARWVGTDADVGAGRDSGQSALLVVVIAGALLALGGLLFQYARAGDLHSRASTAAEAAAYPRSDALPDSPTTTTPPAAPTPAGADLRRARRARAAQRREPRRPASLRAPADPPHRLTRPPAVGLGSD